MIALLLIGIWCDIHNQILNGIAIVTKSGSLHKSIMLVCFPEKTETKRPGYPLWQFTPYIGPVSRGLVQGGTFKEKGMNSSNILLRQGHREKRMNEQNDWTTSTCTRSIAYWVTTVLIAAEFASG